MEEIIDHNEMKPRNKLLGGISKEKCKQIKAPFIIQKPFTDDDADTRDADSFSSHETTCPRI